ncbi:MAG: hypothetical protein ACLFPI_07815 [Desulfobacterales bacterium]
MSRKTFSFSLPEHLVERLDTRIDKSWGISRSEALSRDLDTYYSLLEIAVRKVRRMITRNEAYLILDAMNGTVVETGQAAELWMGTALQHNIADAIAYDALSQKWDVDKDELLSKLNSLEHFERYALADWSRQMWSLAGSQKENADTWEKEISRFQPNPE